MFFIPPSIRLFSLFSIILLCLIVVSPSFILSAIRSPIVSGNPEVLHSKPVRNIPPPKLKYFNHPLASADPLSPHHDSCPTYPCDPKKSEAVPKPGYKPIPNGCGTGGFTLPDGEFKFTPSCDAHDRCYGTCGASRKNCDAEFKTSLKMVCNAFKSDNTKFAQCSKTANMYSTLASNMGCMAFATSQEEACKCVPLPGSIPVGEEEKSKKHSKSKTENKQKNENSNTNNNENKQTNQGRNHQKHYENQHQQHQHDHDHHQSSSHVHQSHDEL